MLLIRIKIPSQDRAAQALVPLNLLTNPFFLRYYLGLSKWASTESMVWHSFLCESFAEAFLDEW